MGGIGCSISTEHTEYTKHTERGSPLQKTRRNPAPVGTLARHVLYSRHESGVCEFPKKNEFGFSQMTQVNSHNCKNERRRTVTKRQATMYKRYKIAVQKLMQAIEKLQEKSIINLD